MTRITALDVIDVRFPTSAGCDGSDAMNPEPDYSAAYVVLRTDDPDIAGYSLLFTTGRGNDVACAAVRALAPYVVGRDVDDADRRHRRAGARADVGRPAALARARRRASCTWPSARWSTPCGTCAAASMASRCGACSRRLTPDEIVRPDRLHVHRRRDHPGRGARHPASDGGPRAARVARLEARRAPRLHDLGRLARLRRRQGRPSRSRGRRRRASRC